MKLMRERLWELITDPSLALSLINAQFRMAMWADVPASVRLRGRIRIAGGGKVTFGKSVMLVGNIVPIEMISAPVAHISVGDESFINYGTTIIAYEEVIIGKRCKIGHYVFVMDNNQHDVLDRTIPSRSSPIILEDDVWIGAHSIILPGVRVGRNSIVGAGSVVKRDVPADCLVAGNPATVKRTLATEKES